MGCGAVHHSWHDRSCARSPSCDQGPPGTRLTEKPVGGTLWSLAIAASTVHLDTLPPMGPGTTTRRLAGSSALAPFCVRLRQPAGAKSHSHVYGNSMRNVDPGIQCHDTGPRKRERGRPVPRRLCKTCPVAGETNVQIVSLSGRGDRRDFLIFVKGYGRSAAYGHSLYCSDGIDLWADPG